MEYIKKLIEHIGKPSTAKACNVSIRYIDLILEGKKKPSKRINKIAKSIILLLED